MFCMNVLVCFWFYIYYLFIFECYEKYKKRDQLVTSNSMKCFVKVNLTLIIITSC